LIVMPRLRSSSTSSRALALPASASRRVSAATASSDRRRRAALAARTKPRSTMTAPGLARPSAAGGAR